MSVQTDKQWPFFIVVSSELESLNSDAAVVLLSIEVCVSVLIE